jgi:hypothetical protein
MRRALRRITPKRLTAIALASGILLAGAPIGAIAGTALPANAPALELDVPDVVMQKLERASQPPTRIHFGKADLYIPTLFLPEGGKYDLIVHFHGMSSVQERNVEHARLNAAIVSVNLGFGSGPYEDAYRDPTAFARLIGISSQLIEKSGRANGAHLGRIALSSWSAGYGAVASILRQPPNAARIDALLMADGPHSDYADANARAHFLVDEAPLRKYEHIARAARAGDKLFILTHSAIHTDDYPSTTETIGELLKMAGVDKTASAAAGPRGMQQIYAADSGDFHVKGYEGGGVKDHVDHIWAMADTMYPYLKARWTR